MLRRMGHAVWLVLTAATILAVALPLQAAEHPAGDLIIVSECENIDSWNASGNLKISIEPDDRREGNKVLSLFYSGAEPGYASTPLPEVAITPTHVFSFQMRGASPDADARFWVHLICENGAYFRKELGVATLEWFEIFLLSSDFGGWQVKSNEAGESPDWTKIRSVRFKVGEVPAEEDGKVLIDHLAFRVMPERPAESAAAGPVVINNCDDAASWKTEGQLKLSAQTDQKQEGTGCLCLSYEGRGIGSATTAVPETTLSPMHVLTFKLRGAAADAKAGLSIKLTSVDGPSFQKELDTAGAEWSDVFLVPADFQASDGADQKSRVPGTRRRTSGTGGGTGAGTLSSHGTRRAPTGPTARTSHSMRRRSSSVEPSFRLTCPIPFICTTTRRMSRSC